MAKVSSAGKSIQQAAGEAVGKMACESCGETTHQTNKCHLYKTRMCSWFEQGACKHVNSATCLYAHDVSELRPEKPVKQNLQQQPLKPMAAKFQPPQKSAAAAANGAVVESAKQNLLSPPALSVSPTPASSPALVPSTQKSDLVPKLESAKAAAEKPTSPTAEGEVESDSKSTEKPLQPKRNGGGPKRGHKKKFRGGGRGNVARGDCIPFLQTGYCQYGTECKYNHRHVDAALSNTWDAFLRAQQLKESKCVSCYKNSRSCLSMYCDLCAQLPTNRQHFCPNKSCGRFMWENTCFYCRS